MTYHEWLERFASLTPETRADLRRKILVLDHQPLISVILPVYNSDLKFLEQAISSVRRQFMKTGKSAWLTMPPRILGSNPFWESWPVKIAESKSSFAR